MRFLLKGGIEMKREKPTEGMLRGAAIEAVLRTNKNISTKEALEILGVYGPEGISITAEHIEEVRSRLNRKK